MAKAIGIDIGSKSLKILELERSGTKLKITFFHNIEIPFGSDSDSAPDLLAETIKNIFQQYRLETENVVLSIPTQEGILREITVDFKDDNHIRQTIKYEAEKHLQAYEIEDVVVDYRKLQVVGEKTKLFVACMPKKSLAQRLKLLEICNLDPMIMDLDIMALVNVARFVPDAVAKDNVAVIDFGAGSTKIVILQKGQLRHIRAIRLGSGLGKDEPNPQATSQSNIDLPSGEEIDWSIENELIVSLAMPDGIEMDRMVLVKKEAGDSSVHLQKKKEEFFKRIIKELGRTMMSLHLNEPIDIVCISGGGSQLEGLRGRIEQAFKVPTILLDFSQTIQCPEDNREDIVVTAPIALGMAMELLDGDCQCMNFRKEEYSYTNRFELMKKPLALLATWLFIFLLIFCYYIQKQRIAYEKVYDQLLDKANIISERIDGEDSLKGTKFTKIPNLYTRMKKRVDEQSTEAPSVEDAFLRWNIVMKSFINVRNRYFLTIDKFNIDPLECVWEGEVENNPEALDTLTRAMRSIEQEVDKSSDKTRIQSSGVNPNPSHPSLKRRYNFQVGFQAKSKTKEDF